MRTIYLCGHGNWDPNDGFINMPKGCSMVLYTHHAKTMLQNAVLKIVEGSYMGDPHQILNEYMSVPNMRLSPDSAKNIQDTWNQLSMNTTPNRTVWFVNHSIKLKDLFNICSERICRLVSQQNGVIFHWCCCRYVDMPKMLYKVTPQGIRSRQDPHGGSVKGADGFNATEDLINEKYWYRDRTDGSKILGEYDIPDL